MKHGFRSVLSILTLFCCVYGSKRSLTANNKKGSKIHLSTFTYLRGGQLSVVITDTSQPTGNSSSSHLMFTLEKVLRHARRPPELLDYRCQFLTEEERGPIVVPFSRVDEKGYWAGRNYQESLAVRNGTLMDCKPSSDIAEVSAEKDHYVPFHSPPGSATNVSFTICFGHHQDEGQYALYLRSCLPEAEFSYQIKLVEQNPGPNYLPAGEIPLPLVYALMSIVFGIAAIVWVSYLCRNEAVVFRIHHLMFVLVLLKTLALMFHSLVSLVFGVSSIVWVSYLWRHEAVVFRIHYLMFVLILLESLALMFNLVDYYFISIDGSPMQTFAMLFYITYLTKGALLFSTLALIGSGWAFIKSVLSDKEKKVFLLVIPLQIFANIAYIITDVSEEGDNLYVHWRKMFMVVDIMCCIAIIFPIKWSIKYLQATAQTDGKAAVNLQKLNLFWKYYIMVVAYFYLTRIFSLVLRAVLPPSHSWIHEFFFESITLAFFVITAYNFRPGADNPYLQVPTDDEFDLIEVEEITTQSGANHTTHRVNHENNHVTDHMTNHVT